MSSGAAAAAAIQLANSAASFGPCVRVEPSEFLTILGRVDAPLVAAAESRNWFTGVKYRYLTHYKGLTFFCKSATPLDLSRGVEMVTVRKMTVPYL